MFIPTRTLRQILLPAVLVASAAAQQTAPKLIPMPRELRVSPAAPLSSFTIDEASDADDRFAAADLRQELSLRQIPETRGKGLRVSLLRIGTPAADKLLQQEALAFDPAMQDEGYILISRAGRATVVAASASGIFYGEQTLKQMLDGQAASARLWTGTIRDWPAMRYRGVHDDLSRGPFPTLAFQKHQIQTLASYKVNLYSPYFEHTLEYKGSLMTAPPGSSLTEADARELVAFARQYHVMIVPEQEAFGHLHHVLKYEQFSDLAETPHGHVLAPGQSGTQPLIRQWFTQIAADFPSPFLHIGADETFELGTGRTKADVDKRGLGPVYADFLADIHKTLLPLHRRLLFWGDVAWNDKSAVQHIPKDMIAIPWIYWHQDNYDSNILPFKEAGIETWVAPGDANWRVVYPMGKTALDNIQGFVESGQRLGSTGELLTVWNDDGEGLFNQDWFGVLFGAAAGWQSGRSNPVPYQQAFGTRFFHDETGRIDEAQRELMEAESFINVSDDNFWLDPWSPAGQVTANRMRPRLHDARLHAERALELLLQVQRDSPAVREAPAVQAMELGARRIDFMAMKFQLSDEMAAAYAKAYALRDDPKHETEARELLYSISSMNGRCQDLRDGYSLIKNLYRNAWLAENEPYWLDNVLVRYDLRIQLWQTRAEMVNTLIENWQAKKGLPSAATAGIPPAPAQ